MSRASVDLCGRSDSGRDSSAGYVITSQDTIRGAAGSRRAVKSREVTLIACWYWSSAGPRAFSIKGISPSSGFISISDEPSLRALQGRCWLPRGIELSRAPPSRPKRILLSSGFISISDEPSLSEPFKTRLAPPRGAAQIGIMQALLSPENRLGLRKCSRWLASPGHVHVRCCSAR